MIKQLQLSFFLVWCSVCVCAQVKETVWQTVQVPVRLSDKITWHNDAGYRTIGYSLSARNYLYRTGLRYHFNQKTDAAADIAWFFSRTDLNKDNHEFGREIRLWQEIVHQHELIKHTSVQLRLRTEQRFFDATSRQAKLEAYRFRYRINIMQQLNKQFTVQLGYEHMHQLMHQKLEFNQLRVQPAVLYSFNERIQLQAMYMFLQAANEKQNVLWVTYFIRISHANRNRSKG